MAIFSVPLLAACAPDPMTLERADRLCREEAGLADGVQGYVGIGIGSDGPAGKGRITITNRVFDPQSEQEFMAECVARRMSGKPKPTTFGVNLGGKL